MNIPSGLINFTSQDNNDDQEHGQHHWVLSPRQRLCCSSMSSPSSRPTMTIGSGQHRRISSSVPPSRRRCSCREIGNRPPYNGAWGMAALAAKSKEQGSRFAPASPRRLHRAPHPNRRRALRPSSAKRRLMGQSLHWRAAASNSSRR
ncbi:hypothetical protein C8R44DRAFT_739827 [Mycena epipterygia]|nr:hypothetical protein C8R44DRAFT_739827 [Mycena epipterygia]